MVGVVGRNDGRAVGSELGTLAGCDEGAAVGMALGDDVGTVLGADPDGDEEGSCVCNRQSPGQRSYIASLSAAVVT